MTDHPMCCIFPYIQGGDKDKEKEKEKDYDHEKEKDARPGGPGTGGPAAAGRHYRDRRSEIGDKGARIPTLHASLFPFHSSLVVGSQGSRPRPEEKVKLGVDRAGESGYNSTNNFKWQTSEEEK